MLKSWGGLLILAFFLGACNSNAPHESDQPETAKGQTQMTDTQPKPEKDQPQTAQPEKKALPDGVYAAFDTTEGSFTARLFVDKTPQTVQNFIDLAQGRKAHRDPQTGQMAETRLYEARKIFRLIDGLMFQNG
ncbi:peptidylprolyl isomerase, partial [bacterium]|nr:peptidylprolyl isomerase [bacterium]